ncbi:hypothetical protein X474_19970 [Dethiosulfatarculus sandiegensis]|uniref:Uncharacterized protein n=1 Tax=Dethiosulfatarculus sandiegensis TaxID=1429043 RepID=A0A0D2GBL5_9BACT|nr:hypothetical protein X474_19970 [Dethiosulfatarculus sandiegensis]
MCIFCPHQPEKPFIKGQKPASRVFRPEGRQTTEPIAQTAKQKKPAQRLSLAWPDQEKFTCV